MEDKSNSGVKKSRSIIALSTDQPELIENLSSEVKSRYEFDLHNSRSSFKLKETNSFSVQLKDLKNLRPFVISKNNFRPFLDDFSLQSSIYKNRKSGAEKALKRVSKNISRIKRSQDKFNRATSNNQRTISEHNISAREIEALYNKLQPLQTLPKFIISLSGFNQYESCQIIVHEKGKPIAESFHYNHDQQLVFKNIDTAEFNNIHTLIRKSKSKLFNQGAILKEELGVVGTFLARDFSYKNHNLLLIISRNDFLQPADSEQKQFENISDLLEPVFNHLLSRDKINTKYNNLILALEAFPSPLAIFDLEDRPIFRNSLFTNEMIQKFQRDQNQFFDISLLGQNRLVGFIQEKDLTISELFHFQRVSLLGELLNTLQHELSNPLFGLELATNILKEEISQDDLNDILNDISHNAKRCQKIIKNFSYLYKDETEISNFDIKKLIGEVMILGKSELRGIPQNVSFQSFENDEQFFIHSNPTWITQILFNFIINASQSIKSKTEDYKNEKIDVLCFRDAAERNIVISVSDSGTGIDENKFALIFNPFFTTKNTGTGLGLAICDGLAKKLNASIAFKNNDSSSGATFSLSLPI